MTQKQLGEPRESNAPADEHTVCFREIQSETMKIVRPADSDKTMAVLERVEENGQGPHRLNELNMPEFFRRWVRTVLANTAEPNRQVLENIAEQFGRSMKTRARESGKYVVLVATNDQLVVAHAAVGDADGTLADVLDTERINKFAAFQEDEDGVTVTHYDAHDATSFAEWLGITDEDMLFTVRGDVKLYAGVDGLDCTFMMDQDVLTAQLLDGDDYSLQDGELQTPDNTYTINKIRWGYTTYEDTAAFLEDICSIRNRVQYYKGKYRELAQRCDQWFTDMRDEEDHTVKLGDEEETLVTKTGEYTPIYANQQIELDALWLDDLVETILYEDEPYPAFHAGEAFAEDPIRIGGLHLHNDLGWSKAEEAYASYLLKTTRYVESERLQRILLMVLFELGETLTDGPMQHVFADLKTAFKLKAARDLEDGAEVAMNEYVAVGISCKGERWFDDHERELVDKLSAELNDGAGIVIGGIDDKQQEITSLPADRFDAELAGRLQDELSEIHRGAVVVEPVVVGDITLLVVLHFGEGNAAPTAAMNAFVDA